jgi:hypothetical protein
MMEDQVVVQVFNPVILDAEILPQQLLHKELMVDKVVLIVVVAVEELL